MRLRHGAASHVGLVRRQNEDSFVAGGGIFAVCDGMGGANAGEVASEAACRYLMELPAGAGAQQVRDAVAEANSTIFSRSVGEPDLAGMGTTLTAFVQSDDTLIVAHVGDSRAYLLRAGDLQQLTDDHSLVGEMVRRGQLTPAQAAVHPHRSVITRALGTEGEVDPDVFTVPLVPGDRLLLCSDGLSGMVSGHDIARILGEEDDPQAAARSLVQAALEGGGEDNVTVVVLFAEADAGGTKDGSESGVSAGDEGAPEEKPVFGPERRQVASEARARMTDGLQRAGGWMRGRRRTLVIIGVAVVLVLVVGLVGLAVFNSTVYFVGTTQDGSVALYQGLPHSILGVQMFSLVELAGTPYAALASYVQGRIDSHELTTKEEGQRFIRSLSTTP
jgi:serine/threonine protein phosphatase PrpC